MLSALIEAIKFTLRDPRGGARYIIGLGLSASTGWSILVLTAIVSTMLTSTAVLVSPQGIDPAMQIMFGNPIRLAIMQIVILSVGVLLVQGVGRWFGGKGDLASTVVLMSWLEIILIGLQLIQTVALVLLPPLAEVIGLFGLALFLWLLVKFVAELHGFKSAWKVFGTILATIFTVSLALAILLVGLGGLPNV